MINYFRELLKTLKSIDASLKRLALCVTDNQRDHGAKQFLRTGNWNL